MREILFRGKNKHTEEWVFGLYDCIPDFHTISTTVSCCAIDPETLGQYTGFKDRNDNRIYEGDILAVDDPLLYVPCNTVAVLWLQGGWYISSDFILPLPLYLYTQCSTIVGNIHDNPELVREAKE